MNKNAIRQRRYRDKQKKLIRQLRLSSMVKMLVKMEKQLKEIKNGIQSV